MKLTPLKNKIKIGDFVEDKEISPCPLINKKNITEDTFDREDIIAAVAWLKQQFKDMIEERNLDSDYFNHELKLIDEAFADVVEEKVDG